MKQNKIKDNHYFPKTLKIGLFWYNNTNIGRYDCEIIISKIVLNY